MYLLDTCVVCERMKAVPDKHVLEWFASVDEESLYLSAVTIGEIRKGIARPNQKSPRKQVGPAILVAAG